MKSLLRIHGDADAGQVPAVTSYSGLTTGAAFFASTEAAGVYYEAEGGTYDNLTIYSSFNDSTSGTFTAKFRKNGAYGNISVSIPSATTGIFTDLINTDSVSAGDTTTLETISATGGTYIDLKWSVEFIPTTFPGTNPMGTTINTQAANTTFYYSLGAVSSATETTSQVNLPCSGVHWKPYWYVLTNTVSATSTATSRKNNADGNITFTIPASTTGAFQDVTHSDVFAEGEVLDIKLVTGATGTNMQFLNTMSFKEDNNRTLVLYDSTGSISAGTSLYMPTAGTDSSTNESRVAQYFSRRFVMTKFKMKVHSNSTDVASTFVSRVGTAAGSMANGNFVVSVPASTTGYFTPSMPTFQEIPARTYFNWKGTHPGSSGTVLPIFMMAVADAPGQDNDVSQVVRFVYPSHG